MALAKKICKWIILKCSRTFGSLCGKYANKCTNNFTCYEKMQRNVNKTATDFNYIRQSKKIYQLK